ncbi:MAG: hypothetical protein IJ666_04650 [Ruminococcus sp.]|nr:hypothetical protein [Ruminococcus sp.]
MRKLISCLLASALICSAFVSCGEAATESSSSSSSSTASSKAEEPSAEEATTGEITEEASEEAETVADEETETAADEEEDVPIAVADDEVEFEDAVVAESGDAYLAINEEQGWIQYWGANDTMLTYNAGVPHIEGNGSYTVSVTADTNGFRYDTAGDANDASAVPSGLMFAAVMIKDGKTLFPDAIITIDSIKVDGNEIAMTAKNYTSSDDGKELRSNIYNGWVNQLPEDAASTEGALVVDGTPTEAAAAYSPVIVDKADFATWKEVEVNFTISGIPE